MVGADEGKCVGFVVGERGGDFEGNVVGEVLGEVLCCRLGFDAGLTVGE